MGYFQCWTVTTLVVATGCQFLLAKAKKFNGHKKDPNGRYENILSSLPHEDPATLQSLPDSWDWRNVSGIDYTTTVDNQHQPGPSYCGSCWAFATVTHLNARFNIARGGVRPATRLSVQVLLTCGPSLSDGCNGGDPLPAIKFIHEIGLPHESCHAYQGLSLICNAESVCQDCMVDFHPTCWGRKHFPIYRVKEYGSIMPFDDLSVAEPTQRQPVIATMVQRMKAEIWKRGPIVCQLACPDPRTGAPDSPWPASANLSYGEVRGYVDDYTPFFNDAGPNFAPFILHNKDYVCPGNDWDACVDHDVTVVGWGKEQGTEFWIFQNSWGFWWGEAGFARIVLGVNNLGIESACFFGVPDLDGMTTDSNGFQRFPMGTSELYADRFKMAEEIATAKERVVYM